MKHVIDIPGWRPVSLNELIRVHWATRNRLKKKDQETVRVYALQTGTPQAMGKRRVRVTITLAGRMKKTDGDNWQKSLLDALVHAGLLVDDSPDWVEVLPVEYVRGPQKATRIELEDVDG